MRNKLRNIYAVQQIDLRLDELHELKGDLPQEAARLRTEILQREHKIEEMLTSVRHNMILRNDTDVAITELKEKVEKYRTQQIQVKTNKQYDALTKEIETSQLLIAKLEKEFTDLEAKANMAKIDSEKLAKELPDLQKEFKAVEKELKEVSAENSEEEQSLLSEKKVLLDELDDDDVIIYERIRKAKNRRAVVPVLVREEGKTKKVRESTCGGCYHRVPPERMADIRKLDRMYTCEHCARILVPEEVTAV